MFATESEKIRLRAIDSENYWGLVSIVVAHGLTRIIVVAHKILAVFTEGQ